MEDLKSISIDDVHENELYIMCTYIVSAYMLDNTEDSVTNHISTEEISFLKKLYKILIGIDNCLKTIDTSCLFLKRFYGKKYYESKSISVIDYMTYHYDMICYKTATLKDLYFKLINHLYSLGLNKKECTWKNINSQKARINNPVIFKILESNYNCLKNIIETKRNNSAHEGDMNEIKLVKMELYDFLISSNIKMGLEELSTLDKMQYKKSIKDLKQKLMKEVIIIRWISFMFTKCIFCSLSDRFAEIISNTKIKDKYILSIEKGIKSFSQSKMCIYHNESKCVFWENCNNKTTLPFGYKFVIH